ncbi:rifampicin phosphotransferase-like isoform X2 [Cloeon dipterum]|uniref:rifampicin phosphotransferase-like isoform X2 n=1 Tax=Cloeon dipterum TaxID=197152 RepID=UPI0032208B4A
MLTQSGEIAKHKICIPPKPSLPAGTEITISIRCPSSWFPGESVRLILVWHARTINFSFAIFSVSIRRASRIERLIASSAITSCLTVDWSVDPLSETRARLLRERLAACLPLNHSSASHSVHVMTTIADYYGVNTLVQYAELTMNWLVDEVMLDAVMLIAPIAIWIVIRHILVEDKDDPRRVIYSKAGWNYYVKKFWARYCLAKHWVKEPAEKKKEIYAITANAYETRLESPRKIRKELDMDGMAIFGCDSKGNSMKLNIVRKIRSTEVWVYLSLADGSVYQLPGHPDTNFVSGQWKQFEAADLKFSVIEPMRKWRITFNGTLRKGVANEWRLEHDEAALLHVRFNFIWTACSDYVETRDSWDKRLLSEALARESWRDGDWLDMVHLEPEGYDQFGVMDGVVRFGSQDDGSRLYLRGVRQRRWGEMNEINLLRGVRVHGVAVDGSFFTLNTTCRRDGLTRAKWGLVRTATGMVHRIKSSNFDLEQIAHHKNLPSQLKLMFSAGGKNYIASVQLEERSGALVYSGHPWRQQTFLRKLQLNVNGMQANGFTEFAYWYRGACNAEKPPPIAFLRAKKWDCSEDGHVPLVCDLRGKAALIETLVGGKAVSLALLKSLKDARQFSVPSGFCVTSEAYARQTQMYPQLQLAVELLKEVATGQKDLDLKSVCRKVVDAFENTKLCQEVKSTLDTFLEHYSEDTIFAVRSSAVGEDSADLSSAGQNSTVLGVRGEKVEESVMKCWASLFSEHSVLYRKQYGQELDPGMAVVVQVMVPATAAGVLFTRHPFTGNPRQILITANYGLGESVVSAVAEPDSVLISRSWNNHLKIEEVQIGSKKDSIFVSKSGEGTESINIAEEQRRKLCLSGDLLLKLAQIGEGLERLFGSPRDIEWAVVEEEIYLLQARPITTLDAWTDHELEHEFDMPVVMDNDILSIANTGEVFPGATKPLTQSVLIRLLDLEIQEQCNKHNKNRTFCNLYQSVVGTTSNHVVISVINTVLSNLEKEISTTNKVMDLAVFGHLVTDERLHSTGVQRFGCMSTFTKFHTIYDMLMDTMSAGRVEKSGQREVRNYKVSCAKNATADELMGAIQKSLPHFVEIIRLHGHMSRVSIFTQIAAMSVLTENDADWRMDHYTDISLLLSSCSNVESAEIPSQLREIAAVVAEEDSDFFTSAEPSIALNWILKESDAASKFKAFLDAHGHRSIREFEFHTLTWGMKPENLIKTLQALVKGPLPAPDNAFTLSVDETCRILKSPTKNGTRRALRFLLPHCRTAVARREKSKSGLICAVHVLRTAYRRLAQLLVREGRLPEAELLFYMSHHEMSRLVRHRDPVLLAKAARRKRLWQRWEGLQFEEILFGVPTPVQEKIWPSEGLFKMQATPVCAGVVLGRACVVSDLSQTADIVHGDILITHCTDIGWSPFFPLVAGIVTELGGLISHGAVIAREYGVPCIVGATNATHIFRTGDIVRLNGSMGVLEKISEKQLVDLNADSD